MAMLYRKDVFDKHGITPPTTWAEFADAAKKIHAADPNVFITDALFGANADWVNGLSVADGLEAGQPRWRQARDQHQRQDFQGLRRLLAGPYYRGCRRDQAGVQQ